VDTIRCEVLRKVLFQILIAAVMSCILAEVVRAQSGAKEATPAYSDLSLAIDMRVDDLVSRMTLEEKVLQMQHSAPAIPRLGIPAYEWETEALHGIWQRGYATLFPQVIGMAATWDTRLIHREAEVIATETRAHYSQAQREGNHNLVLWTDFVGA